MNLPNADTNFSRNQFSDNFSTKIDGGVLVYYVSASPGKITAFKPVSHAVQAYYAAF
jgi:hypothetical protein